MGFDLGYGKLGDELIVLFRSGAPDFEAAEELMKQGADINAVGKADDENILSEILSGYWWSKFGDKMDGTCEVDYNDEPECNLNPSLGPSMCAVIRFFLDHGFDVTKRDGCFGAQCLWSLTLSTFDRYMIDATKILLDAGATNRTISPTSSDIADTPKDSIDAEIGFQATFEHNHSLVNIFEAVYQIYQAVEDGRPYSGIDSYEIAIGKKILKVCAEGGRAKPVFYPAALPGFQKNNCYTRTLYFIYDGGMLIVTWHAVFWTDTVLPDVEMVDASEHFEGVVGSTIGGFAFGHRTVVKGTTHYEQPITTIEMDSGRKVRFSTNFGEAEDEDRAAYFELL